MNFFLQILFCLFTWISSSVSFYTPNIIVPAHTTTFLRTEKTIHSEKAKIGVVNFARSSIEDSQNQTTNFQQYTFSPSSVAGQIGKLETVGLKLVGSAADNMILAFGKTGQKIVQFTDKGIKSLVNTVEFAEQGFTQILDLGPMNILQEGVYVEKYISIFKNGDELIVVAKGAENLLNAEGKFIDNLLETDYAKYLTRKAGQGKTPRGRLDWKEASDYFKYDSPLARGNAFNKKAVDNDWYEFNEVTLANGKRVDGYTPPTNGKPGEIVSRKATNLEEIELSTFEGFLKEMKIKYPAGEPINAPKYGNDLKGKVLEGNQILEIPASNQSFSQIQEYIDLAKKKYNIEIRFKPE